MSVKWKTLATVLLILACTGVASAGTTLYLTFVNDTPRKDGWIGDTGPDPGLHGHFLVGQSNFRLSLPQNPVPDADSAAAGLLDLVNPGDLVTGTLKFFGYCIDTYQTISNEHSDTWTVVDLHANLTATRVNTSTKVNLLKGLFQDYGGLAKSSAFYAAAMGAAVWEIVNEGGTVGYGLSTGDFTVTGGSGAEVVVDGYSSWTMADVWLLGNGGTIKALSPLVNDKQLYALVNPDTQDFVIPIAGVGGSTVPEPFTMLTASLAIGGLGMYVRRRSGRSGQAG